MARNFFLNDAEIPHVLVISGTDSSGRAGLARDVAVLTQLGCQAAISVSAITVQNNSRVNKIAVTPAKLLADQILIALDSKAIKAIKIGMIGSIENIEIIAKILNIYSDIPVILDPVLHSSSGDALFQNKNQNDGFEEGLLTRMLQYATLLTPNLEELALLGGDSVATNSKAGLVTAKFLQESYRAQAILIKGGHSKNLQQSTEVEDILLNKDQETVSFKTGYVPKIMRGTGCFLSSAISAFIAQGHNLVEAIRLAKKFLHQTLENSKP